MKHKLKLKAYEINLSLIDEGYSYSKLYCFGELEVRQNLSY
jgi:hypothetical protein